MWSWESLLVGDTENPFRGTDLKSFIEWVSIIDRVVYFHNSNFDTSYIISELFKTGFEWVEKNNLKKGTFTTLRSDSGVLYVVTIMWNNGTKTTIYDTYKLATMKLEDIAKCYGLECRKGSIDYNKHRPVGYEPTPEEWEYQHNDVVILSLFVDILFKMGLTKMTQSSNAMQDYKNTIGKKYFRAWFPVLALEIDEFCRESYKGGSVQVGKRVEGLEVGNGITLDVNSMYPWAMRYMYLPHGKPIWFDGEYKYNKNYPLYIIKIRVSFELKEGFLPTVQAKHVSRFRNSKFVESTEGRVIFLTLTNIDLSLLKKHYNIDYIEYVGGYMFAQSKNLFKDFIDKWTAEKVNASENGDLARRQLAKDMMNKLSGKFGLKPRVRSKIPYYTDKIHYTLSDEEIRDSIYVPVVSFITAYARENIITAAQNNFDRFCYMDTDSLHLEGLEVPTGLEIHESKLGAYKIESKFKRAKFVHSKCYIEETFVSEEEKSKMIEKEVKEEEDFYMSNNDLVYLKVTCSGMPAKCHKQVTFDNFNGNHVFTGSLKQSMTPNGIILKETTFQIKVA